VKPSRALGPSLLLLSSCGSGPRPVAAPRAAPTSDTLAVPGGTVYFETAGAGEAVVFIHGGFGDRRMWDDQFEVFAARHQVVRYDHRGFGKSSFPTAPYSPAGDLVLLLDHLGIEKAHLVGNSMGGSFALDFTLVHPDRVASLTIVASGPGGWPATPEEKARYQGDIDSVLEVFEIATAEGAERAVALWVAHPMVAVARDDARVGPRLRQMISDNAAIFRIEHWPEEPMDPKAAQRLAEVKVPTLVVIGDRDSAFAQDAGRAAAAGIAGAILLVLPGTDHLPQMEAVDAFNRALTEHLARR
jgi:pimeloyl-ACP methyl ester carboxylesterase